MRFECARGPAKSMLASAESTTEVAGDGRTEQRYLDGPLIQCSKNLTSNMIVALEDSGCDGNGSGCVAVVYGCESLMVDERGDSEDLQWARIVRIGEGHGDVPTGEGTVTHPAAG